MELKKMKIKIVRLLICTLFLTSIFPGLTTAKNIVNIDTSVTDSNVDLRDDLIKIFDEPLPCDMNIYFVVWAWPYMYSNYLYFYDIQTGEIDTVYVGGDIVYPKISENRVVYYDFVYMGFKMYNIPTGEITDLIVTNWEVAESDGFQFFGDYIVYENFYPDLYSTEIYLYNIATSENIQLTDSPGDDYSENPCIYENIVAWQLNEGNIADIVMYNIDSTEYTRVTNTSQFASETFPSIYDNTIVYSYLYYDKVNGTLLYGLKMYDIAAGDETTIFTAGEPTGSTPEIFGDIIAYSKPGVSLCLYDLKTNINTTIYEGDTLSTPWDLNENYIVLTIGKGWDGIYLYKYNDQPVPVIEIGDITGGLFTVNTVIKNTGDAAATNVQWSIKLTGGLIILGKESTGTIPTIEAGASADISSKVILGLGKTVITVTAGTSTQSQNATVLIVLIKT
jgi:hypothetical protein